jgi:ABC-type nitrate/sulfonate/bicarbonate transport system substrate-binding protein
MVDSLRAGLVDGFCVGEPWNSLAVAQGLGSIVVTQSQLFPRAAEKVLALRKAFTEQRPRVVKLLAALDAAAAWADEPANHAALAAHLAQPEYLGLPQEIVAATLSGRLRLGAHSHVRDSDFLYFHRHGANAPRETDGLWIYAQMVRWGQLAPSERAESAAADVFRADLYRESVPRAGRDNTLLAPFDRVAFSSQNVPAYLRQFEMHTPFADVHSF